MLKLLKRFENRELNYGTDIIAEWIANARLSSDSRFLDVGCGSGNHSRAYLAHTPIPYDCRFGIEINDFYFSKAKDYLKVSKVDLEVDQLPYPDRFFSVIVANQVLEHIKSLHWVLSEMDRCLAVGGYFIVGVPNLASLHNRVLLLLGQQPMAILVPGAHVRAFTASAIKRVLNLNPDFKVLRWSGSNFHPFPEKPARLLAKLFPSMAAYTFVLAQKICHSEEKWMGGNFMRQLQEREFETVYTGGKMPQ